MNFRETAEQLLWKTHTPPPLVQEAWREAAQACLQAAQCEERDPLSWAAIRTARYARCAVRAAEEYERMAYKNDGCRDAYGDVMWAVEESRREANGS